ncbi:MAG: phage tail tape measure protein [Firmicutes bacterium]|nr:phage tail tape measure protein [Bacillota bacterium]
MASTQGSQTQHITKLDFDISDIDAQFAKIEEMVKKTSQSLSDVISKVSERNAQNTKRVYDGIISDTTQSTTKLGMSFKELGKSKTELEQMLSTLGKISKITYQSNPSTGTLLGATATAVTKDGKKIIETYKLQEEYVGRLKNGVDKYKYVWKQTSQQIINDIQAQEKAQQKADAEKQKAQERALKEQQKMQREQEKAANAQQKKMETTLSVIDKMIEKQKTFQALQTATRQPNEQLVSKSSELQNQLQQLREIITANNKVDESALNQLATLKQQTSELNTQARVQQKIDAERQKTSQMYAKLFQQQEAETKKTIQTIDSMISKQKELQATRNKFNYKSNVLAADSKELENQLIKMKQKIQAQGAVTQAEKEELKVLQQQNAALQQSAGLFGGIRSSFSRSNFLSVAQQLTGIYGGVYAVQRGLRETLSTIKEVEFGVMEITRVFNDATLDVKEYIGSMFDVATEFGRTFDDIQDTVLRFAQSSYSAEEAIKNARIAMLALNTAELDSTQATQSLIAVMQQWGMESKDFEGVVDRINKTADSFAITSQDLVDGLLKASSVAKVSNVSFEDTIGLLTAMKVSSGAAGKEVGNALKSIFSYIQRPNALKAFEEMGIEVYADKATGTLLPMMEILENMSEKWNKAGDAAKESMMDTFTAAGFMSEELAILTNAEEDYTNALEAYTKASDRANDAETRQQQTQAAGVYRKNYYTALMENFAEVQKVVTNLQDADGYSMQENAKYMETLTAKYNQLIASLQSLAVSLGESGLMDLAKIIVEITAELVNLMNQGEMTIPIVATVGSLIYSAFADKGALIKGLVNDLKRMTASILTNKAATEGMSATQIAYNSVALKTIAVNAGLTLGITALIAVLVKSIAQWKEHEEYMNRATTQFEETMEAAEQQAQSQRDNIAVTQEYIQILENSIDAEGKSRLSKEQIEYYQKKINDVLGESAIMYDTETNKIQINTLAIEDKIASIENEIRLQMQREELEASIRAKVELENQIFEKRNEYEEKYNQLLQKQKQNKPIRDAETLSIQRLKNDITQLEKEMEKYTQKESELVQIKENAVKALSEEDKTLMEVYNQINNAIKGIGLLTDAIDRENQGLSMTEEQMNALIAIYPELQGKIEVTSEGYRIQRDVLEELKNKSVEAANTQIDSERGKTETVINQTNARIEAIRKEIIAVQALALARANMAGDMVGMAASSFGLQLGLADLAKQQNELAKATERLNAVNSAAAKVQGLSAGKVPSASYVGGGSGSGGSKGSGSGKSGSEKSALEIEIEEFEYLVSMGQKTKQDIAEFYKEIAQRAELSAEERKDIEKRLYDALKDFIEEALELQLDADRKRLESLEELADKTKSSTEGMFSALKEYRDKMYAQYEEDAELSKKEINEKYDAEMEYLEKTESARKAALKERDKDREREADKEDYYRRRREILEDIYSAHQRSGRDARLAEREARKKLEDLDREWDEKNEKWNAEDEEEKLEELFKKQKEEVEELKNKELQAVDEMLEKNKAFIDEQVQNILNQVQLIYSNIKAQNGEFSVTTLQQIQSQMETYTALIGDFSNIYLKNLTDPIDAVNEKLGADLERISQVQIDALKEKITSIENDFNETNINMKAYAATKSPELYDEYLKGFIEPMTNGMFEGFEKASQIMAEIADKNAAYIYNAYQNRFIIPLTEEINKIMPVRMPSYIPSQNYSTTTVKPEIYSGLLRSNSNISPITYNTNTSNTRQNSVIVQGNLLNVNNAASQINEAQLSKRVINELNNQFSMLP